MTDNEWRETTVGVLCDEGVLHTQTGPFGSQLHSYDYVSRVSGRCPSDPSSEQKAIAAVLGALDDKIELNRRMNATLEAMARALFQSWFVDFDPVRAKLDARPPAGLDQATAALFPDHLEDSPLGHIPERLDHQAGWRSRRLRRRRHTRVTLTPKILGRRHAPLDHTERLLLAPSAESS
jgi:hypothetical protein